MVAGTLAVRLCSRAVRPAVLLLLPLGLLACEPTSQASTRALTNTGQTVAMSGGGGGAENACFTCHGLTGAGDGQASPRLAGLDAGYMIKQLEDYASETRAHRVMSRVAQALSDEDRRAVSAWYAGLPPPVVTASAEPPPDVYLHGDPARAITACAACHGARGEGLGGGNPAIAAQPAAYVAEQLRLWKKADRRNDPRGVMRAAVSNLSEPEIAAIALWLSRQPASPAPSSAAASASAWAEAAERPAASRAPHRPDPRSGASAPRRHAQGSGSEG
jgi:cytochrome c553